MNSQRAGAGCGRLSYSASIAHAILSTVHAPQQCYRGQEHADRNFDREDRKHPEYTQASRVRDSFLYPPRRSGLSRQAPSGAKYISRANYIGGADYASGGRYIRNTIVGTGR